MTVSVSSDSIVAVVPPRLEHRDVLGAMVHSLCLRAEQSGRARTGTADEVLSAFNEAFNNLALHGQWEGAEAPGCVCEVELAPGKLILRLKDRGPGFDPGQVRPPDFSDPTQLAEGGYGLYIMRSYMNEIHYVRGSGGEANVLTMVRHLLDERSADQRTGTC